MRFLLALLLAVPSYVGVGDDLHNEYDGCVAKFTAVGLRDLLDQLDKSPRKFTFIKKDYTKSDPASEYDALAGKPTGGTTRWNPNDGQPFQGDGVIEDRCSTLYHEMAHLVDYDNGTLRRDHCLYTDDSGKVVDTGITVAEVRATRKENIYRAAQKLPLRTAYGRDESTGKPFLLPPDGKECRPPPPPPPSRGGCSCSAVGAGDPHLTTFDEYHYDFQAVGEFVLTRAVGSDKPLEVQGRTTPLYGLRTVSTFSAIAANVAGDRVSLYRRPSGGLTIHIGGKEVEPAVGVTPLPKGGQLELFGPGQVSLTWPDQSTVDIVPVGSVTIRVVVSLPESRRGKVEGMFGNFDGKLAGELVPRGGAPITGVPTFEQLYRTFGDSWRVTGAESLFDYAPGQGTQTFTDRTFPDRRVSLSDLPNRATAEAVCSRAGVTVPQALEDCALDVALTGDPAFALDAARTQVFSQAAGTTVLSVTAPGQEALLTFPGKAGQKVFVDAVQATIKDTCFPLSLRDPGGVHLGSGCLLNGEGFIDAVVLPVNGDYTVGFKPPAAGQVRVRVITATDQDGTVLLDGPPVTATIGQPGAVSRWRFTGKANQRVFAKIVSATLPDHCFPLALQRANGAVLNVGCVLGGSGLVDGTVLPENGQYTLVIDPTGKNVGLAQVQLFASIDQTGQITVNGPAVTAHVTKPGQVVRLSFNATAGAHLSVKVSSATLPDQCFPVQIRDAAGVVGLAFGCVIGGTGQTNPWTVPATGVYTVVVDPNAANLGTAELRLVTA
ncbi:MAG: VWD domain-containing protein [Micromonosporaceae bacterium]